MSERIYIFDTTLRDGEQSPGASMGIDEKITMARQLARLGVDVVEAGFPAASEGDYEAVKQVSADVKSTEIAALARTVKEDIDRAWDAVCEAASPRLHIFVATSDLHIEKKLQKTREIVLEEAREAVKYAKTLTDNIEFSAEDATRSDPDFMARVFKAVIEEGARVINIPDTVGYTVPQEYHDLLIYLREKLPALNDVIISVHCHNDLGLAVANSVSAIRAGARQIECTVNGIGERAGNTSLEEVVMALRTRHDNLPYHTDIVTEQIYPSSRMLVSITGIPVQPNKAIIGENAFAHEAGIHQDGVLKEKKTYEIMTPESVGRPSNKLVLGKHSGRHAFRDRLTALGFELAEDEFGRVFKRFKQLADQKKDIFDEDIEEIIAEVVLRMPDVYELRHVNVTSGTELIPTASLELVVNGVVHKQAGFGDGPVDAVFKTIAEITNDKSLLLRYQVNAITGGADAQGVVSVRLQDGDLQAVGRGAETDIIVASAKAYVNALNKLERRKRTGSELKRGAP